MSGPHPDTYAPRPVAGAGIVVFRGEEVLLIRRGKPPYEGEWSLPGGKIEYGETAAEAALRELAEETGARAEHVTILKAMDEPVRYDLPEELIGKLWGGKYRGQEQVWYLARFSGADEDIDLEAHNPPEFCDWKWAEPEQLPELIVPFKKRVYRAVVEAFRELV